jgi:hypothetical protein
MARPLAKLKTPKVPVIVQRVHESVIDHGFPESSCILATATLIDVLAEFGHYAEPLVTELVILNPTLTQLVRDTLDRGEFPDLLALNREPDTYSISIGHDPLPLPNYWNGHLVTYSLTDEMLLDPSLGQVRRPSQCIFLSTLAVKAPIQLRSGGIFEGTHFGCLLTYRVRPADDTYRIAPDWYDKARRLPIVQDVLHRLEPRERTTSSRAANRQGR